MSSTFLRLGFLLATLLPLATTASAAGIECARARSPSEHAICQDAALQDLDAKVARRFARAMQIQPGHKAEMAVAQKKWLADREGCAADTRCLSDRHQERIGELEAGLKSFMAYKPDAVDMAALDELRQAVETQRKFSPEVPLERALAALVMEKGTSSFSNEPGTNDGSDGARFPRRRPHGVSTIEWAALKRSSIDGGGENGHASYLLIDLDGDGQRDLVIDSYMGGTGLYNEISALRGKGRRFEGLTSAVSFDAAEPQKEGASLLYSLNGRGSHQRALWVRLQGRVYAAYIEGAYGLDSVYLLRPLHRNDRVPSLSLRYSYQLTVPRLQEGNDNAAGRTVLSPGIQKILQRSLKGAENPSALKADDGDAYLCPPPASATAEEADAFRGFGPSHYSVETVANVPVRFGEADCRLGQLIDWFGAYTEKDGLLALLWVKKPGADTHETFNVTGRRRLVKIDSGLAVVGDKWWW